MIARTLFAVCLVAAAPAAFAHALSPYAAGLRAKTLPTKMIDEIISAGANVTVAYTSDGPHYQPGFFSGGTIYLPAADTPLADWHSSEWSDFYNEAFSAWWGNVFLKRAAYAAERSALLNDASLWAKYAAANPGDPRLAQEEGYSETMAAVVTIGYPRPQLDPATGQYATVPAPFSDLYYRIGWTAAPVSHSDRPGYTPAAEDTYLNEAEYGRLIQWSYGRQAPPIPRS